MSHLHLFPKSGLKEVGCLQWERGQLASFSFNQMYSSLCILPGEFLIPTGLKWMDQEESKGAGNTVVSQCYTFWVWQVLSF